MKVQKSKFKTTVQRSKYMTEQVSNYLSPFFLFTFCISEKKLVPNKIPLIFVRKVKIRRREFYYGLLLIKCVDFLSNVDIICNMKRKS